MSALKVGVVIGRFQPLLKGQVEHILVPATQNSDLVIVLLGSSMKARTSEDPFDNATRQEMIERSLVGNTTQIVFEPIRDFLYANTPVDWITHVQKKVSDAIREELGTSDVEVTLYGAESSETKGPSLVSYHNWFPQWDVSVAKISNPGLSLEALSLLFEEDYETFSEYVTEETYDFLANFWLHPYGSEMQEEFEYVKKYKEATQVGRYPIQFLTVDNVVYYKGNILLIKRRSKPGKGLWALPGGFLESTESCKEGAVRELEEETKLRVRPEWLVAKDSFDHPRRSTRGRTLTNAFLWKIPDGNTFPKVRAGSDASRAKWFPLAQILEEMPELLFEDHLDIITTLMRRL